MIRERGNSHGELQSYLEANRQSLTNYCRHSLYEKQHLEDAIQSVIAIVIEKFALFERGSDFRTWIFKICTNVVYNINKKAARERRHFISLSEQVEDAVAELQQEFAYDELLRHPDKVLAHVGDEMQEALLAIPGNERAVFLLKTIAGLTCREIAETLEIPIGTAMANLFRARAKLRVHLSEYAKQYGFLDNNVREDSKNGLQDH